MDGCGNISILSTALHYLVNIRNITRSTGVHACNPNHLGSSGRRIAVSCQPWQLRETLLQKRTFKGLVMQFGGRATLGLIHSPATTPTKKEKKKRKTPQCNTVRRPILIQQTKVRIGWYCESRVKIVISVINLSFLKSCLLDFANHHLF